jgi:protein SCO1/2
MRIDLRRVRIVLWTLVAFASVGVGMMLGNRWLPDETAQQVDPNPIGGRFSLIDSTGKPVTPATFRGTPYAIFFGFTRCPDVCPTTLSRLATLRKKLGADGDKFQIVFVSVDTGHDKPEDVGAYAKLFDTPILGVTGTEQQIADAAKSFRVFYSKVPVEGGYTMDHSAFTVLMDRNGRFKSLLSESDSEAQALAELRALIA